MFARRRRPIRWCRRSSSTTGSTSASTASTARRSERKRDRFPVVRAAHDRRSGRADSGGAGDIIAIDPNIGIDAIAPMEQLEASSRSRQRFYAVMLGVFAAVSAHPRGDRRLRCARLCGGAEHEGDRRAHGAGRQAGQVLAMIMRRGWR